MVTIFAREITDELASLVKQIDEVVGENDDQDMRAFVVLLAEDPDAAAPQLVKLADEQEITETPLTIFDGVAGPPAYEIAEEAEVTVLMWVGGEVKVNHALAAGELNAESIEEILGTTSEILN